MKDSWEVAFYIAVAVGALYIFIIFVKLLTFIIKRCYCRSQQDLMAKYGMKGLSYAVVTGGSNGFGLEFCNQLAAQGFNICMISRNKSKIDEKLDEIKQLYPDIDVLGVEADLS